MFIIEGRLNEGASLGDALTEVDQVLAAVTLPTGVTRLPSYSAQSNADRLPNSLWHFRRSAALFGVLTVDGVFSTKALIDPLVIMLTVPLAVAGGIGSCSSTPLNG